MVSGLTDRPKRILSSSSTWGELKTDLVTIAGFQSSALGNMDGIVREEGGETHKFVNNNDALPSGDFRVMLQPRDMKFGCTADQLADDLQAAIDSLDVPQYAD